MSWLAVRGEPAHWGKRILAERTDQCGAHVRRTSAEKLFKIIRITVEVAISDTGLECGDEPFHAVIEANTT